MKIIFPNGVEIEGTKEEIDMVLDRNIFVEDNLKDTSSTKRVMPEEDKIIADNLAGEDVDAHSQIKKEIDKDYVKTNKEVKE